VQPRALVIRSNVRQPVGGFEREIGEKIHYRIPRSLCVCTLSRHCG
jgi:hypothetical protein